MNAVAFHALIGEGHLEKTGRKVGDAKELRSEVSNTLYHLRHVGNSPPLISYDLIINDPITINGKSAIWIGWCRSSNHVYLGSGRFLGWFYHVKIEEFLDHPV